MRLTGRGRFRVFVPTGAAQAAVLTWLVALPLGILGVRRYDLNPLTTRRVTRRSPTP